MTDELAKAGRLAAKGLTDNYFLFTTASLMGTDEEDIRRAFLAVPGIRSFNAYGVERISQIINESPRLRMLVPRIYGLGDLSQILDERAYAQASDILSSLGHDLEKFVITEAYRRAQKAIVEHGFVLLLGEPACGKSTIAAALALGALDEWHCFTIKARDVDEVVKHWNPKSPKQFFWVDDAFGATQFDMGTTFKWNNAFGHIQAAIRQGARFVFTSRTYIYQSARNVLKTSALPIMRESQVVIEVKEITHDEREQILYNHIRLGSQSNAFKSQIKPFLSGVASHPNFGPEIARRLGNPAFTTNLHLSAQALSEFVGHPMDHLREVIQTLDRESRAAIGLVFMRGGKLASPLELGTDEQKAVQLMGATIGGVKAALSSLNGSFVLQMHEQGAYSWRFKHPTVRDAMASLVVEDRDLLDIYLLGTPTAQLFQEISCGDVGIKGVKVIVPKDRYSTILQRANFHLRQRGDHERETHQFLAYRCDREFLERFLADNPLFLSDLRVISYFYAVSEIDVIVRLRELGLLPETERLRHMKDIRDLAVETPDAGILREDIRGLFTQAEFDQAMNHVRTALINNLPDVLDVWCDNKPSDRDPEDYMSDYKSALDDFKAEFDRRGDKMAVELIEKGIEAAESAICSMMEDMPPEREYDSDDFRPSAPSRDYSSGRSVFDDVDD